MKKILLTGILIAGLIQSGAASDIDQLLKGITMGCFEMSASYADNKGICTAAEQYNGKIYATDELQYAEYSFATVFSNKKHHLLLNHIEKDATLSLQEQNEKSAKVKSKKLKIDGVEILPTQLEYYITSDRLFEDGNRSVVISFRNEYVIYDYVLLDIDAQGHLKHVLYKYSDNTEWHYSELSFTACSPVLAGELKAKATINSFLQKEGKEEYILKAPYDEYHFQQTQPSSVSSKRNKL